MADTDTQNTDVSAQLSPPVTPAAATPAPQQIGDPKAINANADKTEAALHQVNQDRADNKAEEARTLQPLAERILQHADQAPPVKQHIDLPEPPVKPNFTKQEAIGVGVAILALGVLAGSKGGWMGAATAMGEFMKAYSSGRKEKIEETYKDYELKYKRALDLQKQANDDYHDVLEANKDNVQNLLAAVQVYGTTYGAKDAEIAAQKGDIAEVYKIEDNRAKSIGRLDKDNKKLDPHTSIYDRLKPDAQARVQQDFLDFDIMLKRMDTGKGASTFFGDVPQGGVGRMMQQMATPDEQLQSDASYNKGAVALVSLQNAGQTARKMNVDEARQ